MQTIVGLIFAAISYLQERYMPSFDIVSEVDKHELNNAVDQANREITNRYDFKGSGAKR